MQNSPLSHTYLVTVDEEHSFYADQQHSVLHCMERRARSGIEVGCRGGGCGRCRIKVHSGSYESKKMSRDHIPAEDEQRGIVLACRIFATSDLVIEPIPLDRKSRRLNRQTICKSHITKG